VAVISGNSNCSVIGDFICAELTRGVGRRTGWRGVGRGTGRVYMLPIGKTGCAMNGEIFHCWSVF
jgi:hypothetical protein